ncbi:MAG: serine protease [Candidatus Moduliflexus flocculans]|nr:serine protease [Candidatus Moduliflexus flocculans]
MGGLYELHPGPAPRGLHVPLHPGPKSARRDRLRLRQDRRGGGTPNLFASPLPQEKATLDFVTIAEKAGPAVVRIEADRREQSRSQGFGGEWPFGDDFFDRFFGQPRPNQPESNTRPGRRHGLLHHPRRLHPDQQPPGREGQDHHASPSPTLAGKEYDAKIVGTDPETDLALLKVKAKDVPFIELGDSGQRQGRRVGPGHRQSPRAWSTRSRPASSGYKGRQTRHWPELRGLHPDRRGHQPRQQRRPAHQHEGRGRRHQLQHPDRAASPATSASASPSPRTSPRRSSSSSRRRAGSSAAASASRCAT